MTIENPAQKVRVQVDLTNAEATLLQHLAARLAARSRADLLQQAYGSFLWIVNELLAGRRIVSIDVENLAHLEKYKELSVPAVEPYRFNHYEYLIPRTDGRYKQLYLKGSNMRVGQLIYKMRANQLTTEEAAIDMDLPLPQIKEAELYYQLNKELVDQEADDEKNHIIAAGFDLEPENLP